MRPLIKILWSLVVFCCCAFVAALDAASEARVHGWTVTGRYYSEV